MGSGCPQQTVSRNQPTQQMSRQDGKQNNERIASGVNKQTSRLVEHEVRMSETGDEL